MKKRYVLLTRTKSKYEDMYRYHYKLFNDYLELQKHLQDYWFINKNEYIVFEETEFKKDYLLKGVRDE